MLKRNDLVVRTDEVGAQLGRVMRIESVAPGSDRLDPTCVARAVVFDRTAPLPAASVAAYRPATPDEIRDSDRLRLLPPEIEAA
jgi:hypothetical protein